MSRPPKRTVETFVKKKSLCAICDNTNQTNRLCYECRNDPANIDWSSSEMDIKEAPVANIDKLSDSLQGVLPFVTISAQPLPKKEKIAQSIIQYILEQIDITGKVPSSADIAKNAKCSQRQVYYVLDKLFPV